MGKNKKSFNYLAVVVSLFFIMIVSSFASPSIFASNHSIIDNSELTSILPVSLRYLEPEAFEGTNLHSVIFGSALLHIGDRAFEGNRNLRDVYISGKTESIGYDAFPKGVLIHGLEDSFAHYWALENGFEFRIVRENSSWASFLNAQFLLSLLCLVIPSDTGLKFLSYQRYGAYLRSMRPQDRPELFPINYKFP